MTEIADKQIRRALETVDDAAGVDADINKLSGYSLTAQDVSKAVQTENIEVPGGRIVRGPSELGVRTLGCVENA